MGGGGGGAKCSLMVPNFALDYVVVKIQNCLASFLLQCIITEQQSINRTSPSYIKPQVEPR